MRPLRDLLPKNDESRVTPLISSSSNFDAMDFQDDPCALCGLSPSFCGGLGFVRLEVPVEDPRFGKPVRCQNYRVTADEARIQKLRDLSHLSTHEGKRLENFRADLPGLTPTQRSSLVVALQAAYDFAESCEGWLLITGGMGSGKTHLAAAIGHVRVERGDPVIFITAPDLLDHLRSTYGPTSELEYDDLFDRLRQVPLLIIDDLGSENPSAWAREKLYQLFNHRYSLALPTIVTTNVELDVMDARLRSRLMDITLVRQVSIAVPDYRNGQVSYQNQISDLMIYTEMRFENFDVRTHATAEEQRNLLETLEAARVYAQRPQRWLVLMGKHYGCGKTHLAAAIANTVHDQGGSVIFVTAADLLDKLRRSYSSSAANPSDDIFRLVRDCELLVLDDLGAQNETNWAREKLFQLLNYRYVTARPTVITTGVKEPSDLDARLVTRLMDQRQCTIRRIIARDYASRIYNRTF